MLSGDLPTGGQQGDSHSSAGSGVSRLRRAALIRATGSAA